MLRFLHTRFVLSATISLVMLMGFIGSATPTSMAAAKQGASAFDGNVTAHPFVQPAGDAKDAAFNCQTDRSSLHNPQLLVCYSPQQIRRAYHIDTLLNKGITGKGRTIVIIDAFQDPFVQEELAAFDSTFGLPAPPSFTQIAPDGLAPFDPNNPNPNGFGEEITLDVQWAHAIAPAANIDLVLAKSNSNKDLISATRFAVEHNLGDVISQSFGENEACVSAASLAEEHSVFAEATRKHITLFASSGDQGAAQMTCDGTSWEQAVGWPASDPFVTAVGATELFAAPDCNATFPCPANHPAPGTYDHEIALNEPAGAFAFTQNGNFSTGGGFSNRFTRPAYQNGVSAIPAGQRGVPDIAYSGSINHGVLVACHICDPTIDLTKNPFPFFIFGGTSVGAPNWAGLVALGDQLSNHRMGFINTSLYHIGENQALSAVDFHDITVGNNSVMEKDSNGNFVSVTGFNAAPGWDPTTGFGTPRADVLVPLLAAFSFINNSTPLT